VRNTEQIICSVDVAHQNLRADRTHSARRRRRGRQQRLHLSNGLKKGWSSTRRGRRIHPHAREEAEHRSGLSADWVTIASPQPHRELQLSRRHSDRGSEHEVTHSDVEQVIRAAQSIPIRPDRTIIMC